MDPGLMPNLRRVTRRHGLLPECRLKIDRSESQLSPTGRVTQRDSFYLSQPRIPVVRRSNP